MSNVEPYVVSTGTSIAAINGVLRSIDTDEEEREHRERESERKRK